VHVDGRAVKSCTMLAAQASGANVVTIESMAKKGKLHPIQRAFSECHGLQCGFCTPGMIMATAGLLKDIPNPTDAEIYKGLEGNLCRCTGYINIVKAVKMSAKLLRGRKH
jgi:carbon-monoxide dehydrogenase small subunit